MIHAKGYRAASHSMVYKHFWYTFEARPPFRVMGASRPFNLPSQLNGTPPSIQFATGLQLVQTGGDSAGAKLIASYGEMDCVATLAVFDLAQTVDSASGRGVHGPAAPLLRLLLVLRPDPQSALRLHQMLPFLRSACGEAWKDEPLARHLLTVAVGAGCDAERTGLPPGLGAALRAARARVVCLACSWDTVRSRADVEPDAAWAARVVDQIMCELVPAAVPLKGRPGLKSARPAVADRVTARLTVLREVAGALAASK
jgi:hypothetical protein